MYEEEEQPKKKKKKPGQWSPLDILFAIFGLAAIIALAVAGFKAAQWAVKTYF
ncbi:MAG: hypothetical protein KKB20_21340 [Proteobacteria bacterium]|nr:hypothetical protein [Pseudomonadota bacterium]